MRDIKFRGFSKVTKTWQYGFLDHYKGNHIVDGRTCEESSIGQYLGRKDINGKEIYEGDIFETSEGNCFIRYDVATASFEVVFEDEAVISFFEATVYGTKRIEVIGNIYENKDLLGG